MLIIMLLFCLLPSLSVEESHCARDLLGERGWRAPAGVQPDHLRADLQGGVASQRSHFAGKLPVHSAYLCAVCGCCFSAATVANDLPAFLCAPPLRCARRTTASSTPRLWRMPTASRSASGRSTAWYVPCCVVLGWDGMGWIPCLCLYFVQV